MKNLVVLKKPAEVRDHALSLFRTELLRSSDYLASWIDKLSRYPLVLAEMSDDDLEYPHFGTWFGLTYTRSYSDPCVSDLYYLHEFVHAVLLDYHSAPLFTAWHRKMARTEFLASLETEALVYLAVPGLREISFKDEIWADRFLGGRSRLGESLRDVIRQDRYRAMQSPDPMDYCEQQIAAYARQNFEWSNIWKLDVEKGKPAFSVVEEHMAALRAGQVEVEDHVAWLARQGEIPFPDQAKLFSRVYWNGKLSYRLKQLAGR